MKMAPALTFKEAIFDKIFNGKLDGQMVLAIHLRMKGWSLALFIGTMGNEDQKKGLFSSKGFAKHYKDIATFIN